MSPRVWLRRSLTGVAPAALVLLAVSPLAAAGESTTPAGASTLHRHHPAAPPTSVPTTAPPTVPTTSAPTETTPVDVPPETLLASRTAQGGLCVNGLCEQRYRVHVDGRWDYVDNVRSSEGRLSETDLEALREAVATTRIPQAGPFTELCPTAWDGSELLYGWVDGEGLHEESTCVREIPSTDPLVETLDRLVADAQAVADADVEAAGK